MAIDPTTTTTIRVGQLGSAAFNSTDLVPHEVSGTLKKGTLQDLATFIGSIISVDVSVGFRAVQVNDGETLPATDQQEFILVGPGTYPNVGGGATITTTGALNALVSNGVFWFIGVEIPIEVSAIWGDINGVLSDQTDLNDILVAKADLVGGKVPNSQLPSYVDDVIEVNDFASLPSTGETGKIYVTKDTGNIYRWSGSAYIRIADESPVWGIITGTLSDQTDLQNALNAKQALLSGTGIVKSVGGTISYLTDNSANWDAAYNDKINSAAVTGTTTKTLTLTQQDGGTVTASWSDIGDNLSFTSPLVNTAGVVSIPAASGSANGALSSTDWTTFNNKQNAITNLIDGIVLAGYIPKSTSATSGLTTLGNSAIYDNSGKIGIGTTSPGGKLHVVGEGIFDDGTNGRLTFANASSQNDIYSTTTSFGGWKNLRLSSNELILSSGGTTERMRITSGGNVGIGTTSPIDYSVFGYGANVENRGGRGGGFISTDSGATNRMVFSVDSAAAVGQIKTVTNTPLNFGVNDIERMRITSGGNVGIGTTSPSTILSVEGTNQISHKYNGGGGSSAPLYIGQFDSSGNVSINNAANADLWIGTNNSRAMTIKSGGNVLIGTTANTYVSRLVLDGAVDNNTLECKHTGTGSVYNVIFVNGNGYVGDIRTNGSSTSFNTTSDYRLKQDFKSFNGLDLVSKIKVYDYAWKVDNSRMNGVIAHELQEVVPYAVTGEKDAEQMQSVDYSKLVPILVQAIQELKAEIEILKNK